MSRNRRNRERDSKIVLREVYSIYHDFINSKDLYKELYIFLHAKSDFEMNIIRAEIESEEATQGMISVRVSAMSLIASFLVLSINVLSICLELKELGTVMRTFVIIVLLAILCYCIKSVGDVLVSFFDKYKKGNKRNKYILCVITDILDIRKQNVIQKNKY